MKLILFIIFIILNFTSCKKDLLLKPLNSVEFKNSLKGNYRYFGSFKEKENTIIFFGDLMTEKKIYFHNNNGKLIDSIVFDNKLLQDGDFNLNIISRDTFLLTDKKNMFALNKKNEIIKTIYIDSLLKNELNEYNFKMPYDLHGEDLKKNILISLDWRKNKNKAQPSSIEQFCESSFESPNLGIIQNIFSNNPSYILHPNNYYQYFYKSYGAFIERFYAYSFNNNYIIPTSYYSNKLLFFDENLKKNKSIKFSTPYIKSNKRKPIISETKNFKSARIQKILYSEKSQIYYIILRHEIHENIEKYRLSRPFSIITLDKNFNKIDEKAILDDSYTNHLSFNVDDKIYIKQNLKDESKNIFSVF